MKSDPHLLFGDLCPLYPRSHVPLLYVPRHAVDLDGLGHVDHVVAGQLLADLDLLEGDDTGYAAEDGVADGVPLAVGREGVVDLVAAGRAVVRERDALGREVHVVRGHALEKKYAFYWTSRTAVR